MNPASPKAPNHRVPRVAPAASAAHPAHPSGARALRLALAGLSAAVLTACGSTAPKPNPPSTALPQAAPAAPAGLCDARLATALGADTRVLIARPFKQGEALVLPGAAGSATATAVERAGGAPPPTAGVDLCLVKLLVGPGHAGPAGAPSTSAGIGIEILLPQAGRWNERLRVYGNSGWAGTPQASLTTVASDDLHAAAATKGFVVATSDHGHVGSPIDPSFALKPDGSINTVGWQDFSERSLHVLAETTKRVARAYYGRAHRYAYWDGFSTGGRQGLKLAQAFPKDFDGILIGAPAIHWSRYHTAGLYAPIVMQRTLGGMLAPEKLDAATRAAMKACGGTELGFMLDPFACRYDPTRDAALLCPAGATPAANAAAACLTPAEARVVNQVWYGQTADGSVPDPAIDAGGAATLSQPRIWFGWSRDTDLRTTPAGGAPGIILAADQAALSLQDPTLGSSFMVNATGRGADRWRSALDVAGLAKAQAEGLRLQPQFAHINTEVADLRGAQAAGAKLLMYQGLSDEYIPPQGAIHYYERVMAQMGGAAAVQNFFRLYLVPGFTHSGRQEGKPNVPVPQPVSGRDEMFVALQAWVERGTAPGPVTLRSADAKTVLPACVYPAKVARVGSGYACP